jgi:hypothetical protein
MGWWAVPTLLLLFGNALLLSVNAGDAKQEGSQLGAWGCLDGFPQSFQVGGF